MFFLDSSNNKYYLHRSFKYNDIQYAATAATEDKFTSLGFTKVTVGTRPDARFYFVSGPDNSGNYTSTERDIDDLKAQYVEQVKQEARSLLKETDFHIIQNLEDSATYPIPSAVSTYRAAVRAAAIARCTEINATNNVNELKTLIVDQTGFTSFPLVPDPAVTNYTTY